MKKISIIIPCYNERRTIKEILRRVRNADLLGWEKEIIVVDDCSIDGTRDMLKEYEGRVKVFYQDKNGGKGTAVKRGLAEAGGDYMIIQDADLEYDPEEIKVMLLALDEGKGDVVYGSRNLSPHKKRAGFFIHRMGVWCITKLLNLLYGLNLTDAWTCYKLFPKDVAGDFAVGGFESELLFTAAIARRGFKIIEVPISHNPRDIAHGKKIRYRDGLKSMGLLLADRLSHLRSAEKSARYRAKDFSSLLCCPVCRGDLEKTEKEYRCENDGLFKIDESSRPLLISKNIFKKNSEGHGAGINWLKSFFKQFPKLYYFIWRLFCPVLMVQNGPRKILNFLDEGVNVLNVGSGPERLGHEFINIDVYPFSEVDVVADAASLPFKNNSVDGVVSESLLEHVDFPEKAAKEMARVLKPGGHLYISAPFFHPYHASPDDFGRWSMSGLKSLFPDLEIVESGVRSGPWSALLMFAAYWLGNIFSFGFKKAAPFLTHVFMLVLGPLKIFDIIFANISGAETVSAHLYLIGRKKNRIRN